MKNKGQQKGSEGRAQKQTQQQTQQRPGTEQVRSGANIQRNQDEQIQNPKLSEQQKQKEGQLKGKR